MSDLLNINQCNIAQIIGESNRFLFHIFLIHITTCIVEKKDTFFGVELFKTLLITAIAITLYHIFFRKIVEPKVEKMKLICYKDIDRIDKLKDIDEKDILKSNLRIKTHESRKRYNKKKQKHDEEKINKERYDRKDPNGEKINKRESNKRKNNKRKIKSSHNTPRNYSKKQQILHDPTND